MYSYNRTGNCYESLSTIISNIGDGCFVVYIDINECVENPNICHHLANCENTAGDYYCVCHPGYTLAYDGYTCVGE